MNREDNRLEKNEAFDWKAEIISWIKSLRRQPSLPLF